MLGDRRFIAHIQLHEFETMLFADLSKWSQNLIGEEAAIRRIEKSVRGFSDIEEINDGPSTAPSKRILKEIPGYEKVVAGFVLADEIGLGAIRAKCPHFDAWISRLEKP